MFKIESYITPIILSYVEKYIKNIRPEDSQVSLWGGEVVFQNLDLKLDVLEEELQLPFNFLSGHIHELSIRVPWTKIASEPIVITINTIEFVLKLRDSSQRNVGKKDAARRKKSPDEAPPPGYMATLINKIANNITIRCHNVILKYVEEDIVVSMNIQQLSMESADGSWAPAFIDISPTKVSLRKLISIVDLTICLDKRNSAGKIEVCQEPVLYRSTLQVRVLMKYNVSSQDRSSLTRIDVHSKFLDINVSSQQFPMLMRLFDLALALKQGKIKTETTVGTEGGQDVEAENNQESLLSWAWNLLPSFFPEDDESDHSEDHEFRVLHAGVYVDQLRMIFKTQELIGEAIVGTSKKIKYSPIVRFDFRNFYGEMVACGLKWFNVTLGISNVQVQSVEDCTCGQQQTLTEIFASDAKEVQENKHLENSFFSDSAGGSRKYNVNWNYHLGSFSQEYLLNKSPAIAIDIIHEVQLPDDKRTSEFGSDLEFSNLSEKYMIRGFVGKFRLKLGADTIHRMKTLISYKDSYEYPPYYEEKPLPTLLQLPPPSAEDYEALMNEIPLRQIHLTVLSPTIELHPFDHRKLPSSRRKSVGVSNSVTKPLLVVELSRLECSILMPLYPNRLVFTTCLLPEPPAKLFEACFYSISGNLERFVARLSCNESSPVVASAVNLNHQHRLLIYPELWTSAELNKVEHNLTVTDLKISCNPVSAQITASIVQSLQAQMVLMDLEQPINPFRSTLSCLELLVSHVHLRRAVAERTHCYKLTSRSMKLLTYSGANVTEKSLTALWPDHATNEDFLTVFLQLPVDFANIEHPPIFYAKFLDLSLNVDPNFFEFLQQSQDLWCGGIGALGAHRRHSLSPRKISERRLPTPVPGKKPSLPPTSIHSSSEKGELPVHPAIATSTLGDADTEVEATPPVTSDHAFWHRLAQRIVFHVEISHCTVYFATSNIVLTVNDMLEEEFGENEIFMQKLPLITVNSAFKCSTLASAINRFPISLPKSLWPEDKDSFPWTISLANTSSWTYQDGEMSKLLDETTTNISLVLNFKDGGATIMPASACLHVDTSPLRLTIFKEQLTLLHATMHRIGQLLLPHTPPEGAKAAEVINQYLEITQTTGSTQTAADLKEFLDMTQNSDDSEDTLREELKHGPVAPMSLWLQWTFSKVVLSCVSRDEKRSKRVKLSVKLEDIIYSLDKQEVYSQVKAKIGGMNGQCYEWNAGKASWERNEALSLAVLTETGGSSKSGADTFFNLTITKAETTNVHTKWDTVKKNREQNETLVEVMIKMEQLDLTLDLDLLSECLEVLKAFLKADDTPPPQVTYGVKDLPLILFSSKGLRLFVPLREDTAVREPCRAYILQISSITVHHNVENPICRVPLRPDVYTKAAQMRILNVPGSKIEDRQYELLLKNISLRTANWADVLSYLRKESLAANYHDNPAFEWNNLQEVQSGSDFDVVTIFRDFNFSAIYAPCIIYKNVLICSKAMELNCMSDLLVDIELRQIGLLERLSKKVSHIVDMVTPPVPTSRPLSTRSSVMDVHATKEQQTTIADSASAESVKSFRDSEPTSLPRVFKRSHSKLSKFEEDSGVESYRASDSKQHSSDRRSDFRQRKISSRSSEQMKPIIGVVVAPSEPQTIPYELCFLGGCFKINVYDRREDSPLLSLTLLQPNGLVSLNLLERVLQVSLFDLTVDMGTSSVVKTLPGEPDGLGIPQPIVKTRFVNSLTKRNHELYVDFKRPIKFTISHRRLQEMLVLSRTLGEIFSPPDRRRKVAYAIPKPIVGRNKFKVIKSKLCDLEKVHVQLSQVLFHIHHDDEQEQGYSMKLSLSSVQSTIKVQGRPERIAFALDLEELMLINGDFVIVHPFSFSTQLTLTQEYWKKDPLILAKLNSSYLQIDLCPQLLPDVKRIGQRFTEVLEAAAAESTDDVGLKSSDLTPSREYLIPIVPPRFDSQRTKVCQEEYYQDDLRAGAFQFIESTKINELPLPYQIKIINREVGIICWRYPQPRALHNVFVFPVPMNTAKSVNIQCKLEYFSEINGDFIEICEFTLSENEKISLKLPPKKIAAAIWRIVMTQNVVYEGTSEENDDDEGNSMLGNITDVLKDGYLSSQRIVSLPYRLHPKIFVACMRIDSMFSPLLIPNVELIVDLKPVQLNFFNIVHFDPQQDLPQPFKGYRMCQETVDSISHKFMMLNSNQFRLQSSIYDNMDVVLNVELNLQCDLLDYSHFTFENLFELVNTSITVAIQERSLELKTISDDILVRYGPSIGYNIAVAERIWNSSHGAGRTPVIYSKYIVCNHTHVPLKFGQLATCETIFLAPNEICLYAFRSFRHAALLQIFFNEGAKKIATEPFSVGVDGVQYVRVVQVYEEDLDDDKLFVVRVGSLNSGNIQKRVTIEGQISFFNMTEQRLKFQYRYYKIIPDGDKNYASTKFLVGEKADVNLFGAANSKNQQSLKIAIDGERKGWSGDVPMREIMNGSLPYLVKIPTATTTEGYISYWVRIIREKIPSRDTSSQETVSNERVLVIVWPLFMVESLLTVNTTASEERIDQKFSIYGQGGRRQLTMAGTYSDEHELLFRMNFDALHGEDKRKALLSYQLIDGKTFFQVPDRFKNVEQAMAILGMEHTVPWPCQREEEQRWKRENAIQEATLPLYHCSAAHELSCCLMLSIAPWALFINQLGCQVRLKNYTTSEMNIIEPNNIVMPFYIETGFTLEMTVDGSTLQSELIYIVSDVRKQISGSYLLPLDGSVELIMRTDSGISHLVLTSQIENKVRIFILASLYVVVNYSSFDLHCWSFGVVASERLDHVKQLENNPHGSCYQLPKNDRRCKNPKGKVLNTFINLSQRKGKGKVNVNFNYYLTVYQNAGTDFSPPIYLNRPLTRKSFSVQYDDRYIPLSVSIVAHQGQSFVSIYDDPCPSFAIENRTDFNIYVAQSDTVNDKKAATAVNECIDANFLWHQVAGSRQTVYYTPPLLDEQFPEAEDGDIGLIFACVSGSAIRWSHPVKIDENKSIFLNVPLYGDLKLAVTIRNRTTEVVIDYISQDLEFSAKDIRTRLSNPIRETDRDPEDESTATRTANDECGSIEEDVTRSLRYRGFFKSLTVTFFTDRETKACQKTDLISFNLDRIGVELERGAINRAMVQFVNVQVDNELHITGEYDFSVVLCSEDHEAKERKTNHIPNQYLLDEYLERMATHALCTISLELSEDDWLSVESVRLKINPIRSYIEDTYINILLEYLMECLPTNMLFQPEESQQRIKCAAGEVLIPRMVTEQSLYLAEPIKFRSVRIEPLHVLLSVHACMRLYIALDHSPLDFSAFERRSIRSLPVKFGNSVGMHYLSGAIFGGGWVIASLEILGSPSGLARSVGSGLRDFVSLPVQGLFRGPWGFLVGVTQGSASLIRNVTAGTVNSVTKLATSLARNLDRLTLDSEHVQRTDAIRRRRPQGMTDGFTQGLTGLGISILGAVGGLAHHPLQARNPIDVVTGVGKGIVGAFAKPISGAAELVALTGQGMLHSVGYNTLPNPKFIRQPIQCLDPISYKVLWQPQGVCDGSLLFTVQATLVDNGQYKLVIVALYSKSFVVFDVDQCQFLEVLDLKTVFPAVDETDAACVTVTVRPELPPPSLDYQLSQYPISSRTYQFVRDSTMQLPKMSATPVTEDDTNRRPQIVSSVVLDATDGQPEAEPSEQQETPQSDEVSDENEHLLTLFLEESLAKYLVTYVNLLKKTAHQQTGTTIAFPPFNG